jgi:DNA topoisomerase I
MTSGGVAASRVNGVAGTDALPLSAEAAGLRYTTDRVPGIERIPAASGFRFVLPNRRPVTDEATLRRIRSLAIPPAWTHVWITVEPDAHLQATGRDAKGRKQYRYHPRWREVRHQTKYERMVPFARALPQIRRRVAADMRQTALTRTKVVAAVVNLLERTLIRVGNEEYARANRSFGLTTLRDKHVQVRGGEVRFTFVGKSGVRQSVKLSDARLARLVKRCQDLPGQELFQYIDETGERRAVTSADVNAYLRETTGADFTAKDFRTWAGTLLAAIALRGERLPDSDRKARSVAARAIESVADTLGNTAAVCRACYVHPAVLELYADGTLAKMLCRKSRAVRGLSSDESAVLHLLQGRMVWPAQLAAAARKARRASSLTSRHARLLAARRMVYRA